jgi:hypothetical protein
VHPGGAAGAVNEGTESWAVSVQYEDQYVWIEVLVDAFDAADEAAAMAHVDAKLPEGWHPRSARRVVVTDAEEGEW